MRFSHKIEWFDYQGGGMSHPLQCVHFWELRHRPGYEKDLNFEERRRFDRALHAEARTHFAVSQGGLRTLLSCYAGCLPQQVVILRRERGKPYVKEGPEFNLSNTAGRTFVALSSEPVGLDVERRNRRVHAGELAEKYFFPEEAKAVANCPPAKKNELFLRYWVCKEAMVKLTGDGIYHGLREGLVTLDGEGKATGNYQGRKVCFWEFSPAPDLMGALATWEPLEAKCFLRI